MPLNEIAAHFNIIKRLSHHTSARCQQRTEDDTHQLACLTLHGLMIVIWRDLTHTFAERFWDRSGRWFIRGFFLTPSPIILPQAASMFRMDRVLMKKCSFLLGIFATKFHSSNVWYFQRWLIAIKYWLRLSERGTQSDSSYVLQRH